VITGGIRMVANGAGTLQTNITPKENGTIIHGGRGMMSGGMFPVSHRLQNHPFAFLGGSGFRRAGLDPSCLLSICAGKIRACRAVSAKGQVLRATRCLDK